MKICVIGMGYVGLVTAACFAERGNSVVCCDVDGERIARLERGDVPLCEPGLTELVVSSAQAGRLIFSHGIDDRARGSRVWFIAVGTPPRTDGSADLSQVLSALDDIAAHAGDEPLLVAVKSTVPPGTGELLSRRMAERLAAAGKQTKFEMISNPEFLSEGSAVRDCMDPERVVVGAASDLAAETMRELYAAFAPQEKIFVMSPVSAEIAKYAANTMLAARISMMNELAGLCDAAGGNIEDIRASIAADPRIGRFFLNAGCGYGGSCFPKDVKALMRFGEHCGLSMTIANAVDSVNRRQKERLQLMVRSRFESIKGARAAVLGLAFKPNTDDVREAPSLDLIRALHGHGASIAAYDPLASENARRELQLDIEYAQTAMDALRGADFAVIATEWREFAELDWRAAGEIMRAKIIFDGRNIIDHASVRALGFEHYRIGCGDKIAPPSK